MRGREEGVDDGEGVFEGDDVRRVGGEEPGLVGPDGGETAVRFADDASVRSASLAIVTAR